MIDYLIQLLIVAGAGVAAFQLLRHASQRSIQLTRGDRLPRQGEPRRPRPEHSQGPTRCYERDELEKFAATYPEAAGSVGPVYYRSADGRSADGQANYRFTMERRQGSWRVYIDDQPSYLNRDDSLTSSHRLKDGGRHYVCWTGSIGKLSDAMRVAAVWADSTQKYIATGKHF